MHYSKYFIISMILLLCSQSCYAEDWVTVTQTWKDIVALDKDSINYHNDSLYYNIKYIDSPATTKFKYVTIQSKNTAAGIVQACSENNYKTCLNAFTPKVATNLKTISKDSIIYQANLTAQEIYKWNELKEQVTGKSSVKQTVNSSQGRPGIATLLVTDFGPYMRELQRRIKMNWNPPKGSESEQTVLIFKIAKDGSLLSCNIAKSSGNNKFDNAALNAVKHTVPFRKLPYDYKEDSVEIILKFGDNTIYAEKK